MFRILLLTLLVLPTFNLQAERLKVGVIAGFSGPWSTYGNAYRQGLQMADAKKQIEFIYEDDQFAPAKTIASFHKLIEKDKVQVMIVGDTVTGTAIAPLALKFKIPTIIWASKEPIFLNNPYVIRLGTTPEEEFLATAKILNEKATGSLQVVVHPHNYSSLWGKELYARYDSPSKSLAELPASQQDFKSLILRAKSQAVKNFAICLNPGDNGIFIKQLKQLDYQPEVFACNFIEATADLDATKNYQKTIYFFSSALSADFINNYTATHPDQYHIISVAIMYDVGRILTLALANQATTSLMAKILSIDGYEGAHSTSRLVKTKDDQYLSIPTALFKIEQGKISVSVHGED